MRNYLYNNLAEVPLNELKPGDLVFVMDGEGENAYWKQYRVSEDLTLVLVVGYHDVQRIPQVPPGALPAQSADQKLFMLLTVAGSWTWGGNTFTNPDDSSILTVYWNGTGWTDEALQYLPAGQNGASLLAPWVSGYVNPSTGTAGYPLNASIVLDDGSTQFRNTIEGNTSNPNTGGAGWLRVTPRIDNFAKVESLESKANIEYVNSLMPDHVNSNVINPLLSAFVKNNTAGAGLIKRSSTWYFVKSDKKVNKVGFYLIKDTSLAGVSAFTTNAFARLQVLLIRNGISYILTNRTMGYNDLIKYQTDSYQGDPSLYEVIFGFNTYQLLSGDQIFISFYCNEGVGYFTAPNSTLGNGDWNDNSNPRVSYRQHLQDSTDIIYQEAPVNGQTGNSSALPVDFYFDDYSIKKTSDYQGTSDSLLLTQNGGNKIFNDGKAYVDSKLQGQEVLTPRIISTQNASFWALYNGAGAGTQNYYGAWYYGRTTKKINRISVFAFKDSSVTPFTNAAIGRVQAFYKDGSAEPIKVADINLSYEQLRDSFQSNGYSGNINDYELTLPLNRDVDFKQGDVLYGRLFSNEGIFYFLATNANLGPGEWNRASDNLSERHAGNISAPDNLATMPVYGGAGNTSAAALNFYDAEVITPLEALPSIVYSPKEGYSVEYTQIDGIDAKIVTSNTYNYASKQGRDQLMIICHGNGQLSSSMDGADPSSAFKTYARQNGITWCVIKMQDATPSWNGTSWNTTNTGWGNPESHRRLKLLYEYMMQNYNLEKSIVISGQSMGFVVAQSAVLMGYLPVKALIGIGGVFCGINIRFANASTNDRKNQIRSAWNLNSNGSQDSLLGSRVQGYDNWLQGLINTGSNLFKINPVLIYFAIGTGVDDSYTEFGGNSQRDITVNAIRSAGGQINFLTVAGKTHADATLYDNLRDSIAGQNVWDLIFK